VVLDISATEERNFSHLVRKVATINIPLVGGIASVEDVKSYCKMELISFH
jgi:imidazole glycerol phosphate synthase subunit HisF